jgi:hypothetical protein
MSALACAIVLGAVLVVAVRSLAAPQGSLQTSEYATIEWGGRENTHVIRPSGDRENLAALFPNRAKTQERIDERAVVFNAAMNAPAKEGYEFAGMGGDQVIMKRAVSAESR